MQVVISEHECALLYQVEKKGKASEHAYFSLRWMAYLVICLEVGNGLVVQCQPEVFA